MTVRELIECLQELPEDSEVFMLLDSDNNITSVVDNVKTLQIPWGMKRGEVVLS